MKQIDMDKPRTVIMSENCGPCVVCGRPTKYLDYCYEARLCSEACDKAFTDSMEVQHD